MKKKCFAILVVISLVLVLSACIHDNAYTKTIKEGDFEKLQEYVATRDVNKPVFRKDITLLMIAAQEGNLRMVQYLVENGADVNQGRTPRYGAVTPLRYAIANEHIPVINYLIEQGADTDTRNASGWTPLMTAAQAGLLEVVIALVEGGADVFAETESGVEAIDLASKNGHYDVLFYLGDFYDPKGNRKIEQKSEEKPGQEI